MRSSVIERSTTCPFQRSASDSGADAISSTDSPAVNVHAPALRCATSHVAARATRIP
jgi:hypothetical protein